MRLPRWMAVVALLAYPMITLVRGPIRRRWRRKRNHCITCGYNLTGLQSSRCPECGSPFQDHDGIVGNRLMDQTDARTMRARRVAILLTLLFFVASLGLIWLLVLALLIYPMRPSWPSLSEAIQLLVASSCAVMLAAGITWLLFRRMAPPPIRTQLASLRLLTTGDRFMAVVNFVVWHVVMFPFAIAPLMLVGISLDTPPGKSIWALSTALVSALNVVLEMRRRMRLKNLNAVPM